MDLRKAAQEERERRFRDAVPQVNDPTQSAGRFDLYERREAENAARIEAHRRQQTRELLQRTLLRQPTEAEIEEALRR